MAGDRYAVAKLRSWRVGTSGGLILDLEEATAELGIAADGSVRLRAQPGSEPPPDYETALGREPWHSVAISPRQLAVGGFWIAHEGPLGAARVEVVQNPFSVRVLDRNGIPIATLEGLGFAPDGRARIAYAALPAERFYGFGEKPGGLDQRGRRLHMRNRDPELETRDPLYLSIPFFLSLLHEERLAPCRGVMLDAFAPSHFDVAASDPEHVVMETDAGGIDVTVIPGPTPADVLRRFTARVGRTPLPPLWALGHHQSRWSYASEDEVRNIAAELRDRRIPTDAIHLDIDYMNGYRVFTWNPRRFPDPKQLLSDLAAQGFRAVTIVDPGVKVDPQFPVFNEGVERGFFCRRDDGQLFSLRVWPREAALPDFNREEVREWWGEQHRPLLDAGVAGIWNDMNEPAGWAADVRLGRVILPYRKQDLSGVVQSDPAEPQRTVPHERVRNLYGHQECRATRSFLEQANPERRPFLLTRSGYTGIQRYAAVWTGDNRSRWSHLRRSIPMLLNLSLSGVAFCGADIGGFMFSCSPELYARWIQLGSLYPFARTHSMWLKRRQEPWRFGRRVETIARTALELRMRLLPYLYGLFREAEETGAPVWRPLFYEFPDDPGSAAVEDQLMIGPSLLVAPVVERGAREREVYLPPGRWMAWHDDAQYVGPRRLRVEAPLEHLPIFLRGGSVIPTQSPVRHVGELPEEPCVFEVIPGDDTTTELVEDDGVSTAYRNGAVARTSLRLWDRAGGRLRLEIGRREGDFEIPMRPVRAVVRGSPAPFGVYLDGHRLTERSASPAYRFTDGRVHVRFADRGDGHALEIDPAP